MYKEMDEQDNNADTGIVKDIPEPKLLDQAPDMLTEQDANMSDSLLADTKNHADPQPPQFCSSAFSVDEDELSAMHEAERDNEIVAPAVNVVSPPAKIPNEDVKPDRVSESSLAGKQGGAGPNICDDGMLSLVEPAKEGLAFLDDHSVLTKTSSETSSTSPAACHNLSSPILQPAAAEPIGFGVTVADPQVAHDDPAPCSANGTSTFLTNGFQGLDNALAIQSPLFGPGHKEPYQDDTWYQDASQRMKIFTAPIRSVSKSNAACSLLHRFGALKDVDGQAEEERPQSRTANICGSKRGSAGDESLPFSKRPHLSRLQLPQDDTPSLSFAQSDGAFDDTPPRPPSLWFAREHDRAHGQNGLSSDNPAHHGNSIPLPGENYFALIHRPRVPSGSGGHIFHYTELDFPRDHFDTDSADPRYEDGEVRRYGAGESYRPYNRDRSPRAGGRSPRPARSPPRPVRSSPRPVRSPPRERGRTPPGGSDSYVPGRSPRRRSRSVDRGGDRYRHRDRSREAQSWRRDRSRSRPRSPIRRSSPLRRSPPPRRTPPRYVSPRRDDRLDRARSPRRDYDSRDSRYGIPLAAQMWEGRADATLVRRRSRSPFNRDRMGRNRSPLRRTPPAAPRYRPRSRSPERRDDRYIGPAYRRPSPPRDSVNTSAINSRSASGKSSPRPSSRRGRDDPSRPQSPARSPRVTSVSTPVPVAPARDPARETPREREPLREPIRETPNDTPRQSPRDEIREPPKQPARDATPLALAKSPPRGPAALRAPPTGPAATRNGSTPVAPQGSQVNRHPPPTPTGPSRPDVSSPSVPPSGPRGYIPPRGGFAPRGGVRGGWGASIPPRHMPGTSVSPTIPPPTGPSGGIPTGPRAASSASSGVSPSLGSKPFNPPTGPAAHNAVQRPSLAQNLMGTMPSILPSGKIDPVLTPMTTGVVKELEVHHRKLKEEEERIRDDLKGKQEKLRKYLRNWDKMERESKAFELKSDLSEKSLNTLAGEGLGGAAF